MTGTAIEFFATFLIWILYAGLVVLWFIDGKIKKEQVIHALIAGGVAWTLTLAIKNIFPTLRPYMVNGLATGVLFTPTDGAFPSAHTAMAFSLAVTIFMHDGKIGWAYLIGALFIGVARVVANVHYPIDILGGALIGTSVALIIGKVHLLDIFNKRRKK